MKSSVLLFALMTAGLLLAACAPQSPPSAAATGQVAAPGPSPGPGPRGSNLSQEQRQQMFQQMTQQAAAACQGLAIGDNCTLSSPRGNRTGTCENQNDTVVCRGNFRGPPR